MHMPVLPAWCFDTVRAHLIYIWWHVFFSDGSDILHLLPCFVLESKWRSRLVDMGMPLRWCQNERNGISNHQPHDCLVNRLFRHRSKKTSKLWVSSLCEGKSPVTGDSLHKGPVMRKMFPFGDVITPFNFQQKYNCRLIAKDTASLTFNLKNTFSRWPVSPFTNMV